MIRLATPDDLDALLEIETESFTTDRLSRASYRRLLRRDSAVVLVYEDEEHARIAGAPSSSSAAAWLLPGSTRSR